ncbi:MAG: hypothetical protein DLM65_08500 [Candidatus Aeolococcus gillhamiae]|uniref:Terminase large subunit gp17-like C-terminal domain-containing protein n=1 Tax=Candidatus Aeolococcus gillhamiae TaxID=3127015 RepID=A0A2W5Z4S2_9BACT|nr:MAG: hypothetical protein DLM65_08500 [Candidatus Dormibacter sp. RRmetagenome_bin12]
MSQLARDLARTLDPVAARAIFGADAKHAALSPASLALAVDRRYEVPPHLELLDSAIVEAVATGGRLLVEMPPRHGKSELCSHYTPAWFVGTHPEKRVMLASYEADFAAGWGRKARDVLEQHGSNLFGVEVRADSAAAARWDLRDHAGGMVTAGVAGAITGRGADLLIIDDPVKSVEESESDTYRDRVWEWWRGTALTRLEPGGSVIVIMTRWHEDDLAGRLLSGGDASWHVLRLPALAEEGDLLSREPGEALWPARYDADMLARRREEMGTRLFSAEYQQEPVPAGGSIFRREWFRYYRPVADGAFVLDGGVYVAGADCRRVMTCDLAVSTKTSADYTVLACWAVTKANQLLLLDLQRSRMEGPDIVPALRRMYESWHPATVGIESVAFQLSIVQEARRAGLPVRELKPDRDKVSRALTAAARMEGAGVFFRAGAPYLGDLEAELLRFPAGRHDDMVDVLSYAIAEVTQRRRTLRCHTDDAPASGPPAGYTWRPLDPRILGL